VVGICRAVAQPSPTSLLTEGGGFEAAALPDLSYPGVRSVGSRSQTR
jgi:hypothetical protein